MEETKQTFEQRLEALSSIVAKIEGETLPLEEALKAYEEGKKFIDSLQKDLKEAEEKIKESLKEE